ncbi:MAG: MgtC/SapB family protein [Nitrospirae bacterium]|nr:MAG: MgtC/SapB family protein [Nitrospirota bacterium]
MTFEEVFLGFLIALAAGALIGLERQQDRTAEQRASIGGVRTFPLIALTGALSALASYRMGVWPIFGALLVIGAMLAVAYAKSWERRETPGVTTPIAALITFLLGVLALHPDLPLDAPHRYLLIVGSASVVMALLSFKEPLHRAVKQISDDDIYATAKFVLLALVVLPLLPNRTMGPLHVLNPFHIGVMVVLVAGMSFLAYIATRLVGPRKGMATTGLLGGLVSSTAVTVSMATQGRQHPGLLLPSAMAILAASSTMFIRMLVIVLIVSAELVPLLALPLGTMCVAGYLVVASLYVRSHQMVPEWPVVEHRNPFELTSALTFGAMYAGVLFVVKAAHVYFGDQGLYVSSVLAGTTDVDAITLSMVQFHKNGLDRVIATSAITLAAMSNTVVKALLALWLGGWELGKYVGLGMGAMLVTGGAVIAWLA